MARLYDHALGSGVGCGPPQTFPLPLGWRVARPFGLLVDLRDEVADLGEDQLVEAEADGRGRSGKGEDDLVPDEAGDGAAQHRGGADLLVGERAEDLPEPVEAPLEERGDGLVGPVAPRDPGAGGLRERPQDAPGRAPLAR